MLLEDLQAKRNDILRIAKQRGAYNIRVFGSVARREDDEQSDIDFLVDMERGRTLLDQVGLWQDLQELLGRKVDVVIEQGLREGIHTRILKDAVAI